jgi:hypothetical protein
MNITVWRPTLQEILNYTQGLEGEEIIRNLFKQKKISFFQADLIFKDDGEYCLAEIKHQEPFEPPPFYGHGLPIWQIDARLKFYEETHIVPWLFVVDVVDKNIYYQKLTILNDGEKFDTNGERPRRIFPITQFKVLKGSMN